MNTQPNLQAIKWFCGLQTGGNSAGRLTWCQAVPLCLMLHCWFVDSLCVRRRQRRKKHGGSWLIWPNGQTQVKPTPSSDVLLSRLSYTVCAGHLVLVNSLNKEHKSSQCLSYHIFFLFIINILTRSGRFWAWNQNPLIFKKRPKKKKKKRYHFFNVSQIHLMICKEKKPERNYDLIEVLLPSQHHRHSIKLITFPYRFYIQMSIEWRQYIKLYRNKLFLSLFKNRFFKFFT